MIHGYGNFFSGASPIATRKPRLSISTVAMGCLLLTTGCESKTEDSKGGKQTDIAKRPVNEEKSVPVVASRPRSDTEHIQVGVYKGLLMEPRFAVGRVETADPDVAVVMLIKPSQVLVVGQREGQTRMTLTASDGQTQVYEVSVDVAVASTSESVIRVAAGETVTIRTDVAVERQTILATDIAEIQASSPFEVSIIGVREGATQVFIWTDDDRVLVHDVVVGLDDRAPTSSNGGTIKGVAKWEGKPYTQKPLPGVEGADPYCTKAHKKNPILSEQLVINDNNTVRDVFVYVKSGLPAGETWPVTADPVVLDQNGCHYVPHIFGIMVSQELQVKNSDNTLHNINAQPKNNEPFNTGQPKKGMVFTTSFETPEMMVKLKCDSHPWMNAYCAVMEHPFFATTDENGNFEITDLPDGEYVIATWHERFKKDQERIVKISGGRTAEVEFVFKRPEKKKKGS